MKHIIVASSSLLILLSGCKRAETTTYDVPKEPAAPVQQQSQQPAMGSDSEMQAVQAAHASMMAEAPKTNFKADLPEGWTEKPGSGMRMESYTIKGTSIDFYLISLGMGDVPSNVNRWRGQVGLPDASADDIAKEVETFKVDGHDVHYVKIYNEEGGKGVVAAIVDLSPSYWYFTAKGSVDELKAHEADIHKFIESLKFQ